MLHNATSYAEVTYPQGLENCRKCHDGADAATPEGDNWQTLPSLSACFGCHDEADHPGGAPPTTNSACWVCHVGPEAEADIAVVHTSSNPSPNNPDLIEGEVELVYDLIDATVDGVSNEVTINARLLADGEPLDVENLPADLAAPGSYPAFLLAYALPQDGIAEPMDYNNIGQRAAQAISIGLDDFFGAGTAGTHSHDGGTGVSTFVITDAALQFPAGATLRAVGLQGYFQQDIDGSTVTLHTPSRVVAVTGDDERRLVVDSAKCADCHEWFEGHGGNRTYNMQICTFCHVPSLSSTGRTVVNPALRDLDDALAAAVADETLDASVDPNDPLTYPEDAQNLKDLVHAIHASGDRGRPFQHIRGPSRQGYYDWSEVTFPRGASPSNCSLCHDGDSYALPLADDLLATTVRTTTENDGLDLDVAAVESAFVAVPNSSDWVNTPTASSCYYCHTSVYAKAHMEQNGAMLSDPSLPLGTSWSNRGDLGQNIESCAICHGPDKMADLEVVHDR